FRLSSGTCCPERGPESYLTADVRLFLSSYVTITSATISVGPAPSAPQDLCPPDVRYKPESLPGVPTRRILCSNRCSGRGIDGQKRKGRWVTSTWLWCPSMYRGSDKLKFCQLYIPLSRSDGGTDVHTSC